MVIFEEKENKISEKINFQSKILKLQPKTTGIRLNFCINYILTVYTNPLKDLYAATTQINSSRLKNLSTLENSQFFIFTHSQNHRKVNEIKTTITSTSRNTFLIFSQLFIDDLERRDFFVLCVKETHIYADYKLFLAH